MCGVPNGPQKARFNMYQLYKEGPERSLAQGIKRVSDGTLIPFSEDNRDYQRFKKEVLDGEELQDAEGNTMTTEEVEEFVATLP